MLFALAQQRTGRPRMGSGVPQLRNPGRSASKPDRPRPARARCPAAAGGSRNRARGGRPGEPSALESPPSPRGQARGRRCLQRAGRREAQLQRPGCTHPRADPKHTSLFSFFFLEGYLKEKKKAAFNKKKKKKTPPSALLFKFPCWTCERGVSSPGRSELGRN